MTPEAANYLGKAREDLSEARQIAGIGLGRVAARSACYAVFHAAEALIVDKTGRVAKSHSGVRSEFARLTRDDPRIARTMTAFLAQAYKYKEIGDYGIGAVADVALSEANVAIGLAGDFVDCVDAILA
jgi:uncharacterized protein (UPF0332 family)